MERLPSRPIPDDETKLLIKTLAWYVHRGYPLEASEPPLRGRKGPARDTRSPLGFTVLNPQAFDAIRWELMKAMLSGKSTR